MIVTSCVLFISKRKFSVLYFESLLETIMKNTKLISTLLLLLLNIQTPAYAGWKIEKPKIIKDIAREATSCFGGGCDPDRVIKVAMKSQISNATEGFSDEIQESVIEASDHVFDNQIDPLIERTAVLATKIMREGGAEAELRANNIIENAVEDIVEGFDPWLDEAFRVADEFTPEKIEEHLINTSFARLDALEEKLFSDANKFLSKTVLEIGGVIENIDCKTLGQRKDIENFILTKIIADISIAGDLFNRENRFCRREIGVSLFKKYRTFENGQIYDFRKCILEKDLTIEQKPKIVLSRYADLAGIAGQFACIEARGVPKRFTGDWLEYTKKYDVLDKLVNN